MVILDDIVAALITAAEESLNMLIIMRNPSFPESWVKPSDDVVRGFFGVSFEVPGF